MITMKKRSLFFLFALFFGSLVVLNSCSDDEETFSAPSVTAPANGTVISGEALELSFSFTANGGFKSSSVQATNGTATVSADGTAGSTSGTIKVNFTGGNTAGAASVVLTVTDNQSQTGQTTAVVTVEEEETQINVSANITANTTWETGKVYILTTRVAVTSGFTLTIQPGVIVKGQAGTGSNATALIIARGAKIMAEGTAASPIIFTSVADEIMPGTISSPNLDPTLNGLWGGLLILGKAPIKASAATKSIEGIPADDQNGLYGGDIANDDSGVLKYVSIRHGGSNIGEGNEINGLTLGGVGSATTIENIEIVSNQDDGIEWFGGTVNVKNALIWNTGDDAVDGDQGWTGTLDNFIIINPGDKCFELDGPEGSATATGNYTLQNGSVKAGASAGLVDNDANTNVNMNKIYFFNVTAQTFDQLPTDYTGTFADFQVTLPAGKTIADLFLGGSAAYTTAVAAGANTVGADKTKFAGWSWAATAEALAGF